MAHAHTLLSGFAPRPEPGMSPSCVAPTVPRAALTGHREPRAEDLFKATAARMRAFRASSSSLSPSWKSMARLALPSRLELKRPEGSFREAPLAKVIFTTFLYVSPVQISPSCDQTGVPLHFHSSATSGSASLIRARSRESISPLQSPRSSILASISSDGDSAFLDRLFFTLPCLSLGRFSPLPCDAAE